MDFFQAFLSSGISAASPAWIMLQRMSAPYLHTHLFGWSLQGGNYVGSGFSSRVSVSLSSFWGTLRVHLCTFLFFLRITEGNVWATAINIFHHQKTASDLHTNLLLAYFINRLREATMHPLPQNTLVEKPPELSFPKPVMCHETARTLQPVLLLMSPHSPAHSL